MNILVTGRSGFIGSRLIRHLLQNDSHHVISIDKFPSTGFLLAIMKNTRNYLDSYVTDNILSRVHVVIHLAGFLGVDCESNPKDTLDINGIHTAFL